MFSDEAIERYARHIILMRMIMIVFLALLVMIPIYELVTILQ